MTSSLRNELLFGTRALLRDTPWSQGRLRALQRNEAMSRAELAVLQAGLLHKTLRTAIARLPFYAHIDRDFPVSASFDVLRAVFPIIDKGTLLANRHSLYPNGGARQPWQALGTTSGTTGAPLEIFRSVQSVLMEQAFVKRHWAWGGYHDGMVRASLRGDLVADTAATTPPFWFWNRYNRQLLVSSRHLNEEHTDAIIDRLEAPAPACSSDAAGACASHACSPRPSGWHAPAPANMAGCMSIQITPTSKPSMARATTRA